MCDVIWEHIRILKLIFVAVVVTVRGSAILMACIAIRGSIDGHEMCRRMQMFICLRPGQRHISPANCITPMHHNKLSLTPNRVSSSPDAWFYAGVVNGLPEVNCLPDLSWTASTEDWPRLVFIVRRYTSLVAFPEINIVLFY